MVYSMTGFASETRKLPQGELTWEVRSVNHRYLETQFKLPDAFRALEHELRQAVGQTLKRGKVDLALQFRPVGQSESGLSINNELAAAVIKAARAIQTTNSLDGALEPLDVLRWPGVIEEQGFDTAELAEPIKALLEQSLAGLKAARQREGEQIAAMLESRLEQVSVAVAGVRARLPEVMGMIKGRILERARSLEVKVEPERLEQELVLLAQKLDVAEELDRLDAHIVETRTALKASEPVGRRLDFLMQEFNREANTLASKAADPDTSTVAVDLKVLIEQMREQVQNVE